MVQLRLDTTDGLGIHRKSWDTSPIQENCCEVYGVGRQRPVTEDKNQHVFWGFKGDPDVWGGLMHDKHPWDRLADDLELRWLHVYREESTASLLVTFNEGTSAD